jgi:hypothetical protein
MEKINTTSLSVKWWTCFVGCVKTNNDGLSEGKEFKISGNELIFNATHTYNRLSAQWHQQFREPIPTKSHLTTVLKREEAFIELRNSVRMDGSKNNTSAYVFDLQKLQYSAELLEVIEWKKPT